ncbi:MAG: peptide chain release factor N(5)-glutamine methyltransferase [Prolixibacteraceae bacterium]|nr:peptide chain release factor N(5)-glutamine methyltransferase [Prolixibacteraceae bacterium]
MEELYQKIRQDFERNLSILEDKPEETVDSTIKALWNKAFGISLSATKAAQLPLPQLSEQQKITLLQLAEKRISGTPLAHLTGRQNFMGIEFRCDKRALIPRKETEILGQSALELCKKIAEKKTILNLMDVCCGSGNLGLALAFLQPDTIVYSSDLSPDAVALTKDNISFLNLNKRVEVVQSDLFSQFESDEFWGEIDLIVCNPPYISSSKVLKMNSEIAVNEPSMAFDGGMIGLKVIQKLIQDSPRFLSGNGWLIFEVGLGQGPFVIQLCEKSNQYQQIKSFTDNDGHIRVIAASKTST